MIVRAAAPADARGLTALHCGLIDGRIGPDLVRHNAPAARLSGVAP